MSYVSQNGPSLRSIERYCRDDVKLTQKVYDTAKREKWPNGFKANPSKEYKPVHGGYPTK